MSSKPKTTKFVSSSSLTSKSKRTSTSTDALRTSIQPNETLSTTTHKKRMFSNINSSSKKSQSNSTKHETKNKIQKVMADSVHIDLSQFSSSMYPSISLKSLEDTTKIDSINSLRFTFMSDEEVKKYAVIECKETTTAKGGQNTVYDPRMGPKHSKEKCEYCKEDWITCPGHFGYIEFAHRIPHPLKTKTIIQYLTLFCSKCYRLIMSQDHIELYGIDKYKGIQRFERLLQEAEKFSFCTHCNHVVFKYTFEDDKFLRKNKKEKFNMTFKKIEEIFQNIPPEDIVHIGLDPKYVHPMMLLIKNFPVIPPCSRSYCVKCEGQVGHDDLTNKYNEIIKINNSLKKETNEKNQQALLSSLMIQVLMLMDYSKVKQKNNERHVIKSIKQRLAGKSGQIRNNLQGKRLDFCGRTVIIPEAMGEVDELGVPEEIAKRLSIPVKVTKLNIQECQRLLNEDKVNIIIRNDKKIHPKYSCFSDGFKLFDNDIVIRNGVEINVARYEILKKKPLVLQEGDQVLRDGKVIDDIPITRKKEFTLKENDVIERQLKDGDWTLFNRQPTLWKGSMRGKKIKILPGKTFRFNLASTEAYNADFDGDVSFVCFFFLYTNLIYSLFFCRK